MLAKLKQMSESAYDLMKALVNAKLDQSDLNNFRSHVNESEIVPKNILDKQVFEMKVASEISLTEAKNVLVAAFSHSLWKRRYEGDEADPQLLPNQERCT